MIDWHFLSQWNWNYHYLNSQFFLAFVLFVLMQMFMCWHRGNRLYMLLYGYVMLSAGFLSLFPISVYHSFGLGAAKASQATSAHVLVFVILATAMLWMHEKQMRWLGAILKFTTLVNSVFVLVQSIFYTEQFYRSGLMQSASMNACFLAVSLPLLCFKPERKSYNPNDLDSVGKNWKRAAWDAICVAFPVAAILLSGSSMGIITLGVVCFGYLLANRSRAGWAIPTIVVLVAGIFYLQDDFADSSGRVRIIANAIDWQWGQGKMLLGSGPGSFQNLNPGQIQIKYGTFRPGVAGTNPWYHAHSDWAQILFELGAVGLFLSVAFFGQLLSRARKTPWLWSSLAGYGVFALGNMPMHYPLSILLGIYLVRKALDIPPERRRPKAKA